MKKKTRGWPILLMAVFLGALVLWFFWRDVERFVRSAGKKIVPGQTQKPSQEEILEEERKKLEGILKRGQ